MSHQWKADRHLRHAIRMARAVARPFSQPPTYFSREQKDAWWIVQQAKDDYMRKEAMKALMSAAYELNQMEEPHD